MKITIYILLFASIFWSCSGGSGGNEIIPPTENTAPTTPILVSPTNNLLCINNELNFTWNASIDKEGNPITYFIEVAKNNLFSPIDLNLTSISTSKTITLEKGIAYYWRVKAADSKGAESSYSNVYSFYTEDTGVSNHLPFLPILISPNLGTVVQSPTTTLQWSGSDTDISDILTYDVYFGTVNPPTAIISSNQSESTFLTPNLNASTTYYWKIVVKDDKGGQTIGQIWNFITD